MSDNKFTNSNNKYKNCPALMSDGRSFTDYRAINHINNLLISNNNIENNYAYREFLTQNAEKIIENNKQISIENNKCDQCKDVTETKSESTDKKKCLTGIDSNDNLSKLQ
jgi:hypothetical protein